MSLLTEPPLKSAAAWPVHLTWQAALRNAIRQPRVLLDALQLADCGLSADTVAAREFPLFVAWEYAARMEVGNRADPLFRQVWVSPQEDAREADYQLDPVGDRHVQTAPGLLQKYAGRALMVLTGACAVHCRYCFRRHYPYSDSPQKLDAWAPALHALREDDSISEIILSGGDPLTWPDDKLRELIVQLDSIPHLRRLRIHTRLPVIIPQRVCDAMLAWLSETRLSKWIVVHINHANEIDAGVAKACEKLRQAGATVLNQSVLLRGVNDDVETLIQLSHRLMDCSIVPYYLHQLDAVQGAAHFHVSTERGLELVQEMTKKLPGYGVPKYVREIPGEPHKSLIV